MATKPTGTGSITALPTFTTGAADAVTTFTRDKLDRVTMATDAEGFHEDYALNAFGDRTSVTNKLGGVTTNVYDKRGLLIQETLPVGSTKADGTAQAGGNIVNKFEYDASGNRTRMIEAFGFPEQRTTDYTYDKDGQLKTKVLVGSFSLVDGGTMGLSAVSNVTEYYTYDANGNLIEAKDGAGGRTLTYYDAANRKIAQVSAVGTLSAWTYDANGNVVTARTYGDPITLPGSAGGTAPAPINAVNYRETVYGYDLDNRLLTSTVVGVTTGRYVGTTYATSTAPIVTQNQYDAAGNLVLQTDANGGKIVTYYNKNGQKIGQLDQAGYVTSWTRDQEGNVLTEVRYANKFTGTPGTTLPLPTADAANDRTTQFTYDKNGRRKTEARLNVQATTVSGSSVGTAAVTATITYTYNGLGLVTSKQEATGDTTNYGYDLNGRQTSIVGQSFTDYTGATVNGRQDLFYDGLSNVSRSLENTSRVTTYAYGTAGRLSASTDAAGNTTNYTYDAAGRVTSTSYTLLKASGATQTVAQAIGYDAAGRQTSQKVFQANGAVWNQTGDMTDNFYNAFGEVIARGTNIYPGAAPTTYTVRDGDTLYSIASALWGDQAMWFLIAEANGITASTHLVAGQRLIIPNKVTNFHNTSGTFRVYDPGEAIGDTMPTLPNEPAPPPAKKKGCGGFGAILLGIVAIAVTIVTAGAALSVIAPTAFPTVGAGITGVVTGSVVGAAGVGVGLGTAIAVGAGAAAIGSIVSQGIGVATGLQDSFNWKAVGLSALGGGLAGGASGLNVFGSGATGVAKIANVIVRSALTNAAVQGIGVATGLQDKFSWSGVAAAGVGAGIGSAIAGSGFASGLGPLGERIATGVAGGLAASAAESLITGRDFGDTLMGNLPGMIANTVGSIFAGRVAGRGVLAAEASGGTGTQPSTGRAAGQVGNAGDEIVVTAPRSKFSQYVDYFPQVTAALVANDLRSGGSEYAATQLKTRIVHQLAAQASAASSRSASGYAALDALDGKQNGIPSVAGWASTEFELATRVMDAEADFASGAYDANVYRGVKASLAANAVMVDQWNAIADGEVNEIFRGGLAVADVGMGGYNIATGNGGLRDYLALGSIVPVGKMLGAVGRGAESGIAQAVRLGREGEAAAGIAGPKVGVNINGRMRFPDQITQFTIKEVKNVARQGWTRQLRDYSDLAKSEGKTLELWIRGSGNINGSTIMTRPLQEAVIRGEVVLRRF